MGLRTSGARRSRGTAWRGRGGGGRRRRSAIARRSGASADAAAVAGELRAIDSRLHKKTREEASEGAPGHEEEDGRSREGSGMLGAHRNRAKTAAEWRTPASNCGGLGARLRGEVRGNGEGVVGLLIGQEMEGNQGINRRH